MMGRAAHNLEESELVGYALDVGAQVLRSQAC